MRAMELGMNGRGKIWDSCPTPLPDHRWILIAPEKLPWELARWLFARRVGAAPQTRLANTTGQPNV